MADLRSVLMKEGYSARQMRSQKYKGLNNAFSELLVFRSLHLSLERMLVQVVGDRMGLVQSQQPSLRRKPQIEPVNAPRGTP